MSYDFNVMSRDQIILDLVSGGMSLNKATKHYVQLKKDAGLSVGVVSHRAEAMAYLAKYELTSPVNPKPLVEDLTIEFGVKPDTAMNYIKAYCDEHALTIQSRLASTDILQWITDHAPEADGDWDQFDEDFKAWMKSQDKSESNINEYRKGIKLHQMLMNR